MLKRLADAFPDAVAQLTLQYRMHEDIMTFSSLHFYEGELEADKSVAGHLLRDLEHVQETAVTSAPVQFMDTAGAGFDELLREDSDSRANPSEGAKLAKQSGLAGEATYLYAKLKEIGVI